MCIGRRSFDLRVHGYVVGHYLSIYSSGNPVLLWLLLSFYAGCVRGEGVEAWGRGLTSILIDIRRCIVHKRWINLIAFIPLFTVCVVQFEPVNVVWGKACAEDGGVQVQDIS